VFPTFAAPATEDPACSGSWDFESLGRADGELTSWRVTCPEGAGGVLAVQAVLASVVPLFVERALFLFVTGSVMVVG